MGRDRRPSSEHDARLVDAVVAPRYDARFAQGILDALPHGDRRTVLELGCGTGHLASAILRRVGASGRVIAVDPDEGLVDLARRRGFAEVGKRLFFKVEGPEALSFGNEVFDVVVGNLVWEGLENRERALREARRVLVPGGPLHLTTPLRGTFTEVHEMMRELARNEHDGMLAAAVDAQDRAYPTAASWRDELRAAGFADVEVIENEWRLSFESAAALFADSMLQVVAVPRWVRMLRDEDRLRKIERRLDVYLGGGPLSLSVCAGRAIAR